MTTARTGCANLIATLRRMVDDAGTADWSADQMQEILDRHRADIWQETLKPQSSLEDSETVRKVYLSNYENFEEVTSGTTVWRVYDSDGTMRGTADYSTDYTRGIITFTADQEGSARYLDARSYDLDGAAADCWREKAATVSDRYDIKAGQNQMSRSQYFKHCLRMADYYGSRARPVTVTMFRSDLA